MIRARTRHGALFIGLNRRCIEALLRGDLVTSPGVVDDDGVPMHPTVHIGFAETDADLDQKFREEGLIRPTTPIIDWRSS